MRKKRYEVLTVLWLACVALVVTTGNYVLVSIGRYHNSQFVRYFHHREFSKAEIEIEKAIQLDSTEAMYHANKGLLYYLKAGGDANYDFLNLDAATYIRHKPNKEIETALTEYQLALKLNPNHDGFWHNQAWLYLLKGDLQASARSIQTAISLSPQIHRYYITAAIIEVRKGNKAEAARLYSKSIVLSPDIVESRFFDSVRKSDSIGFAQIINASVAILEHQYSNTHSPIAKAKLACLYIHLNFQKRAIRFLEEVTVELPNLSRPHYYLAIIEHPFKNSPYGDKEKIQKAMLLNNSDALPPYRLGAIHLIENDTVNAVAYFKMALMNLASAQTENSILWSRYLSIHCPQNDLIPQSLLPATSPQIPVKAMCNLLAHYYMKKKDKRSYEIYKSIALDKDSITTILLTR